MSNILHFPAASKLTYSTVTGIDSEFESRYWEKECKREPEEWHKQWHKCKSLPRLIWAFEIYLCVCTSIFSCALRVCIRLNVCAYACVCFIMQAAWIKMTVWCLVWISGLRVKQLFIPTGWHKQTQIQLHIYIHTHTHTHTHTNTFHKPYCAITKVTGTWAGLVC